MFFVPHILDNWAGWRSSQVSQRHQVEQGWRTKRVQARFFLWWEPLLQEHCLDQDVSHDWWRWAYPWEGHWVWSFALIMHLLFLFLKTRESYWSFINCYSGRRLSGILENVWPRRSLKRSQRRDPKTQSRSLRLRSVRVSSTFSVPLKFLMTRRILMMTWYGHPQDQLKFLI